MKLKTIQGITILTSLSMFGISLTKNAIIVNYLGATKPIPAYEYFLMGSTAIIGGGALEWIIWLANPLCLLSIILLISKQKLSMVTSSIALILAISFSFWKEILGNEGGTMSEIVSFESGYYLWLTSILVLTTGIYLYFHQVSRQNMLSE